MRNGRLLLLLLPLLALVACGRPEQPKARPLWPELYEIAADDVPAAGDFIRYVKPGPKGGGLDIAVTEYEPLEEGKPRLQLLGVVHVADRPYYQNVQKVLDRADLVLFEAIKPKGKTMQDWLDANSSAEKEIAGFQEELCSWFGFEYQLSAISYAGERFVHADMSLEQFLDEGGDEVFDDLPIGLGSEDPESLDPEVKSVLDKIRAFGRDLMSEPNPIRSLARRLMAEVVGTMDTADTIGMFPGLDDLVLRRRNEVVMEHLAPYLEDGKTKGTIAIFYGAAHNLDLEERILALGYRRASGFWLRAWALRPPLK